METVFSREASYADTSYEDKRSRTGRSETRIKLIKVK